MMASTEALGGRSTADDVVEGIDLGGRRVVVTGANTGIGFETARALAAAGATVILTCRDAAKCEATVARIRALHPDAEVIGEVMDLAAFRSIRAFAERLGEAPVDALVCNAGLAALDFQTTEEGIERTVGVCHFGHFLLTRLLIGRLLAAPAPRVVMVSSESHRSPRRLDFDRFPLRADKFRGMVAYGQAKLCNVLFARALQARYGARGLTACALHPGTLVTTDIGRGSALIGALMRLVSPFTKTANQGAATTVWAVVHEPAGELAGAYLRDCALAPSTSESQDAATAERLWVRSDELVTELASRDAGFEAPGWP
jgi:WW domain-containing oxidoreductase